MASLHARARPGLRIDVPLPVLAAVGCAALMASVSWAVLAAGWVAHGGGGAVVVAVAAAVEAALLAQANVPRLITVLIAPVLALAAIVPTTLGAMPFDGNTAFAHTAGRYLGAIAGGLGSSSDWSFTVGLCTVLWICGYWVGWMALRERRGVLAVLPLYAVLGTNVLNTKSPDSVLVPEGLALMLSLLVIAGTHFHSLQTRWSENRTPALRGTRVRYAATVAIAATLLTGAALLIPPASSVDISGRFFGGPNPGPNGAGRAGAGAGRIQFSTGTVPGGALISEPATVLTYTVDTASPVYLAVIADAQFVAGNWFPNQGSTADLSNGIGYGGLEFRAGALPRDNSIGDGAGSTARATVHATIVLQPNATGATSYAPFTGEPAAVDHNGSAFGIIGAQHPDSLLTVDSVQLDSGIAAATTVHSTATVSTATADQLRRAGTAYPAFANEYLSLPDDQTRGANVIAQLAAQWTQGTTDPYDAAIAIETHLRDPTQFTYTLSPPQAPASMWPVVYFLTQSHRGYCQYFASAMGAMLRSLGVPALLVNGYGPGTAQAQSGRPASRQQVVSTSDAHTWVEAFFPGYGWIPFEPTPPSGNGDYVPIPRGAAAAAPVPSSNPAPASPPADVKPGFNDPLQAAGGAAAARQSGPSPWLVLGLIAAGLVALGLGGVLWLLLPRSLRGAWRRVEAVGALRGLRRHAGETHRQYAQRLSGDTPTVTVSMSELAALLGRAEFSRAGGDRSATRRAVHLCRRVLLALAPRTLSAARRRG